MHINDYYNFNKKDPKQTGIDELRAYFQSMLTDGNHKPGSVKMGYYALRFLFKNVYHKQWAKEYLPTPKIAKTLPLVLSKEEVFDVLSVIKNFKHRTLIMFIYATGARVSECVNIKITDIDSKRMQVNIQEGKGLKQRKVPLSPVLLKTLRGYFKQYKPTHFFFEGASGKGTHLGVSAVREICKNARYHAFYRCNKPAAISGRQTLKNHGNPLTTPIKSPYIKNVVINGLAQHDLKLN